MSAINRLSQKWVMLEFLQKNKDKQVLAIDFEPYQLEKNNLPFCWAKPWSRLSELKKLGLVEIIWKRKASMKFLHKCKDSFIYQLTIKGLYYKMI